jgi:hypothetical protein
MPAVKARRIINTIMGTNRSEETEWVKKPAIAGPFLLSLAAVLCLTALGTGAFAEPFRFGWEGRIAVAEQYDDNVTLSADAKEHDWITYLTPGVTLSLIKEETDASLSYDFSLMKYARDDGRSRVRHYLTLTGFEGIPVSERVALDLDAVLRISEDPFEIAPPGEDVTDITDTRTRYYRTRLGGRINYSFGPESLVYVGFTHLMLLGEDPGTNDRQAYLPSAGFDYWFSLSYGIHIDYSYGKAEYELTEDYEEQLGTASLTRRFNPRTEGNLTYTYNDLDYDGPSVGYAVHEATVGISREFSGATAGSLSGGVFVLVPEEGDSRAEPTGSLTLTHTAPRSLLALAAYAGYRRQFFQTANLGISLFTRASVTFTYQLMQKLSLSLEGAYFRDEYLETTPESTADNWRGATAVRYLLGRWLFGSIAYVYRQRESDFEAGSYVNHLVTLSITAVYTEKPSPL